MNWGCLSFLILFPAGIFIWVRGEMRRRNALPPEELKKLEAEEDYGPIDEKLECIFCHSKNCVRTRIPLKEICYENMGRSKQEWIDRQTVPEKKTVKAYCMNCNNSWEMFLPEEKANQ